jgi:hypothetical protein
MKNDIDKHDADEIARNYAIIVFTGTVEIHLKNSDTLSLQRKSMYYLMFDVANKCFNYFRKKFIAAQDNKMRDVLINK